MLTWNRDRQMQHNRSWSPGEDVTPSARTVIHIAIIFYNPTPLSMRKLVRMMESLRNRTSSNVTVHVLGDGGEERIVRQLDGLVSWNVACILSCFVIRVFSYGCVPAIWLDNLVIM